LRWSGGEIPDNTHGDLLDRNQAPLAPRLPAPRPTFGFEEDGHAQKKKLENKSHRNFFPGKKGLFLHLDTTRHLGPGAGLAGRALDAPEG